MPQRRQAPASTWRLREREKVEDEVEERAGGECRNVP